MNSLANVGTAKKVIDEIVAQRSKGNPMLAAATRTKLLLKGINHQQFKTDTPDDPNVIKKLKSVCRELGVHSGYLSLN